MIPKLEKLGRPLVPQINGFPVAFTVALTQLNKPIGDHQTIKYDHVITNLGYGYEPGTGHFTCPLKGLYLFAVTAMSAQSPTHDLYTEVVKNGARVTKMYSTPTSSSSTTSVFLITLDVGDMIWVRTTYQHNQIIHGDNYDTFSGTLIYQMS
ncbi:hypothetical protein KUTeg_020167 [Tegillarca granosa]|uniref:C1q domain-containing protein n=1 Tax=Tegillarca granosa TaxID=220873 RepID=A0ABQ9ECF9_TEGGR|nr:hypothetical protein KUTeg_020167 [Tegillarca granosa]